MMKKRIAMVIIAGAATAVVVAVVGSVVVALRRGWALADEDADLFLPSDRGAFDEDTVGVARSEG